MRTMHVGVVAALAFFIVVVDETEAQQYSAAGLAAGNYVSGRISGVAVGNQPVIVGGLLSVPVVTGTFTGEPIVSGGSGGQPVVSGEVLTAMSTTLVAPVVTTFPMQGEVMPYSYWVSAPKPRGFMSSMGRATSSLSRAGLMATPATGGHGITWAAVTADTWRSTTIHLFGSEHLSDQSQATDLKRNGARGEVLGPQCLF